mmetsp:Transcript_21014/g.24838  ORF Transcript_21014/g.24838 Transcript_21014/m.24838 type:complete len:716 (+) Transcript_21014:82-2229(+)
MGRIKIPKSSTRLVPERNHREVMQRARAFRIFEIQCAIVKNRESLEDTQDIIEFLTDSKKKLEKQLQLCNKFDDKNQDTIEEEEVRTKLLRIRNTLLERLRIAQEKYGSHLKNIGDIRELNTIDVELNNLCTRGKVIAPHPTFSKESIELRVLKITKEIINFKKKLISFKRMEYFLSSEFDGAYDDEEHERESDDEEEHEEHEDETDENVHRIYESIVSNEGQTKDLKPLKNTLIPSLPERDASKFFLLAHMLDYLCDTQSFDLHGKVFYDLTGSSGMIVTAAQYCLQDGGKLTSELDDWANTRGLGQSGSGDYGSTNGGQNDDDSKFSQYKRQKETQRREALLKAEREAEEFERAAEEEDARAEAEAKAAGKVTAADIEAKEPVWPYNQVYALPVEEEEVQTLSEQDPRARRTSVSFTQDVSEGAVLLTKQPLSNLREIAITARTNMLIREEAKANRLEELLIRGKAFAYKKTPDPRWSRIVSFEANPDSAHAARELVDIGLPKRKGQHKQSPLGSDDASVVSESSFGSPHSNFQFHNSTASPLSQHSRRSSQGTASSSSSHKFTSSSMFGALLQAEVRISSSPTSHNSPNKPVKKDPKLLAKSLQRRRSHIEVRETDFLKAGHDWEDGDVVYFDTGSDLYFGMDEGVLILKLEECLKALQPGSFAIIVTRSPFQMIDRDSDQLWVVMNTCRLLQGGEKISAWLVKITQPVKRV